MALISYHRASSGASILRRSGYASAKPIEPREVVTDETDDEVGYEGLSTLLRDKIQKILDEMRGFAQPPE